MFGVITSTSHGVWSMERRGLCHRWSTNPVIYCTQQWHSPLYPQTPLRICSGQSWCICQNLPWKHLWSSDWQTCPGPGKPRTEIWKSEKGSSGILAWLSLKSVSLSFIVICMYWRSCMGCDRSWAWWTRELMSYRIFSDEPVGTTETLILLFLCESEQLEETGPGQPPAQTHNCLPDVTWLTRAPVCSPQSQRDGIETKTN